MRRKDGTPRGRIALLVSSLCSYTVTSTRSSSPTLGRCVATLRMPRCMRGASFAIAAALASSSAASMCCSGWQPRPRTASVPGASPGRVFGSSGFGTLTSATSTCDAYLSSKDPFLLSTLWRGGEGVRRRRSASSRPMACRVRPSRIGTASEGRASPGQVAATGTGENTRRADSRAPGVRYKVTASRLAASDPHTSTGVDGPTAAGESRTRDSAATNAAASTGRSKRTKW